MPDPEEEEQPFEEPVEDTVPVVREEETTPRQKKDGMSTINEKLAALKPGWSPKNEDKQQSTLPK